MQKEADWAQMLSENAYLRGSMDMAQTPVQGGRYAKALRQMMAEQNADSFSARYQELERKYLDGSILPDEADELWRLERMRGQFGKPSKRMDGSDREAAEFFGLSSLGNLSSIVKRGTIKTQGGFECFPDGDPVKRNIQNVKPIRGFFDVAMHGEPDVVRFGGRERNMTARVLASVIRHSEGYTGQNIRLLSCSTGKREGHCTH